MKKVSVRGKLFLTLCVVILMIILFLVIINKTVLETYYYYSKKNECLDIYTYINENINNEEETAFQEKLKILAIENSFDILIKNGDEEVFSTNGEYSSDFGEIPEVKYDVEYNIFRQDDIMYSNQNVTIRKIKEKKNGLNFILLLGTLDNGNTLYIRTSINLIQKSVNISNRFLYIISFIAVALGGIAVLWITDRFTGPIEEMKTIRKLQLNNLELEKDIERKSKIDEMRKQFISDVSHELKTPIALIQGYSEGLIENVNTDEESRKFYAEVILDEANKMDSLVKKLLELMKLEYGEREFNDAKFDIVELINDIIRNSKVMLEEQNIKVSFKAKEPIYVFADIFYIEQVVRNYFTNAIKNVKKVNNQKKIDIFVEELKAKDTVRVTIFNTGDKISEENLNRIWTRFYKVDKSRNRNAGGTGIGLALVKAVMNQYGNDFGVKNRKDGVEFFFEINVKKKKLNQEDV